jgi:SSS family solute:Na+ symporter
MPMMLREWAQQSTWSYVMAVLVLTGTLAAIMSTADSVLLSLSSILAKDFLGKTILRGAKEDRLTAAGKRLSWMIMGGLALVAFSPRITLWGLIELKAEILIQVAPAFILGVVWPRLHTRAALAGLVVGASTAAVFTLAGAGSILGLPPGLFAFLLNAGSAVGLTFVVPATSPVAAGVSSASSEP